MEESRITMCEKVSGISRQMLEDMLEAVSAREGAVLRYRCGMHDGCIHTREETGKAFGITDQRVCQIENKVLRRLQHRVASERIRDFYNA